MNPEENTTRKTLDNPYVGPSAFEAKHKKLFFGRDREAKELISLLLARRLVLFYAESGAGKSSLVNARLIPSLEDQKRGFEVLPKCRVISGEAPAELKVDNIFAFNLMLELDQSDVRPERFAEMGLSDFLLSVAKVDGKFNYVDDDVDASSDDAGDLGDQGDVPLAEILPRVLIIDQFEEIFTTHLWAWDQREAFFVQLSQAMEDDPFLYVVLVMREDYVARLDPYVHLLPGELRTRYYMRRMRATAALDAVQLPAKKAGREFDTGVAEELVDNLRLLRTVDQEGNTSLVSGEYIEPVQLQVVCLQLWEDLKDTEGDKITDEDVKRLARSALAGRDRVDVRRLEENELLSVFIDTALAGFYERALAKVMLASEIDVDESYLRDWFSHKLITEEGTRGFLNRGKEETAGVPEPIVTLIEKERLVRTDTRAGAEWIELVHDRFVEPIQEANRNWTKRRIRQTTWVGAAYRWEDKDRIPALLLQDGILDAALQAAGDIHRQPRIVREFLEASTNAQTGREQKLAEDRAEAARREQELAEERAEAARRGQELAEQRTEAARREQELAKQHAKNEAKVSKRLRIASAVAIAASIVAVLFALQALRDTKTAQERTKIAQEQTRKSEEQAGIAQEQAEIAQEQAEITQEQAEITQEQALIAYQLEIERESEALRLISQAQDYLTTGNPTGAILLSKLSYAAVPSEHTQGTMWAAMLQASVQSLNSDKTIDKSTPSEGPPGPDVDSLATVFPGPESGTLATLQGGKIISWNIDTGETMTQTIPMEDVVHVAFDAENQRVAAANGNGEIKLWDYDAGEYANPIPISSVSGEEVTALALSADGQHLAAAFCIVNTNEDETITPNQSTNSVIPEGLESLAPTGTRLADIGITVDKPETSTTNERALWTFVGEEGDIINIAMNTETADFDPYLTLLDSGGRELISDDDGGEGLNALITGYILRESGNFFIRTGRTYSSSPYTLSLTKRLLCESEVRHWGISTVGAVESERFASKTKVTDIVFDGRNRLIWLDEDGEILVTEEGELKYLPRIQQQGSRYLATILAEDWLVEVNCSDLSPDCRGRYIHWWSMADDTRLATTDLGDSSLVDISSLPEQNAVVILNSNGDIAEWKLPMTDGEWNKRTCEIVGRNLNAQEWQKAFADSPYKDTCEQYGRHPSFALDMARVADIELRRCEDRGAKEAKKLLEEARGLAESASVTIPDFGDRAIDVWLNEAINELRISNDDGAEDCIKLATDLLYNLDGAVFDPDNILSVLGGLVSLQKSETNQTDIKESLLNLADLYNTAQVHLPPQRIETLAGIFLEGAQQLCFGGILDSDESKQACENLLQIADTVTLNVSEVSTTADRPLWIFQGREDDFISIAMDTEIGDFDPYLTLFDSSGRELMSDDDGGDGYNSLIADYLLPDPGPYYIRTGRSGSSAPYTLTVTSLQPESIVVDGEPQESTTIETSSWIFEGQEGDIIDIAMDTEAGDFDPYLTLLDSNVLSLISDDDGGEGLNALIAGFLLPETGVYYIRAGRAGRSSPYTLTVTSLQPESIVVDGEPRKSTTIETSLWTFAGEEGDLIDISMNTEATDFDPYLTLLDSGGRELISDDDSGDGFNSLIAGFFLPEPGPYHIRTGRSGSSAPYTLTVTSPQPESIVVDGEPQESNTIETSLWTFEGEEGDIINISMDTGAGDFDPYLTLLDSNGRDLISNDGSGEGLNALIANYFLPETGVYYIRTGGSGSASPYMLSVTKVRPADIKTIVTDGEPQISTTIETSLWTLEGDAGEMITISLTGANEQYDPHLRLLNESGKLLAEDDDGGQGWNGLDSHIVVILPATGSYYIVPGRSGSSEPYTLSVSGGVPEDVELDDLYSSSLRSAAVAGAIDEALSLYETLQEREDITLSVNTLNALCWLGALARRAEDVIEICDQAVETDPENGNIHDSRAVALALEGRLEEAADDFEFAVRYWRDRGEYVGTLLWRGEWIDPLRQGDNPLDDDDVLQALLNE